MDDTGADAVPGVRASGCAPCVGAGSLRRYRDETVALIKLAGPVAISQLLIFSISTVSMVFCGHLGKTELAGVSLAAAMVNIMGISIGFGLASTCDTLISQTYGSGNLKRVGVILQRGILILLLACFPCWAVLINTEPLLLAFKQSPEVASLSQLYVKIFMISLPGVFMYQLEVKYLQNQGVIWPQVITGGIANLLNAGINFIFLYCMNWGVAGSATANAITQYMLALLLYVYIRWTGLHKSTWAEWSLDCLQEWGSFISLAIPSMIMACLSWWTFEIEELLSGVINEVELGAQSIAYQLTSITYMIPLGFSGAACVRVGNALGAGNIEQAKLSCKVSIICAFIIACLVGIAVTISRDVIGYIFTSEHDVIQRFIEATTTFGIMNVGIATGAVATGVLRGAGKQLIGAIWNVVGYYGIGIPIGAALMFAGNMGIVGLWIGNTICVSVEAIFFIIVLFNLNWRKAVGEALVRAGVHITEEIVMAEKEFTVVDVYQSTKASGSVSSEEEDSDRCPLLPPLTNPVVEVKDSRPLKQLLLRRGLVLLIMIFILITGIVTSNRLTKMLT